jgi:peroxiredoxin Q/BCP
MAKTLQVGDAAPAIELPDQDGKTRSLADHRGRWVLVYFYPRDDTPGCTVEACGIRDAFARYRELGIEVLGISADSVKSHRKFADKHRLGFTLLSDEDKGVIRRYGSWGKKKFMGREFDGILRQSFLVDPQGKIAKVYAKVRPEEHAEEVLADVRELADGASARGSASKAKPAPRARAAAPAKAKGAPKGTTARKSAPKRKA